MSETSNPLDRSDRQSAIEQSPIGNLPLLNRFVADREGFTWQEGLAPDFFELTSGTWKTGPWKHDVALIRPAPGRTSATAVLYITGGDANEPDIAEAKEIANRSGLCVALLFHIPNQPILELWEDDLVAHTFEEYIETGDPTWPLLFPMARAAVRCMDMLQELGFEHFVVTGASKRGWTAWLAAGTGDPRIAGLAPMVIDNLNFPAQMAHQMESWGAYSEQIEDYTRRELQGAMDSERGAELTRMMDPVNYLDHISCPILVINGANDRYWAVDALSLYWDLLPPSKRCLIVPNAGHLLGDKVQMIETLSAFAWSCACGELLPKLSVALDPGYAKVESPKANEVRIWVALSESLDFRESEWSVVATGSGFAFELPTMNVAAMAEARYSGQTGDYNLSTPVRVLRRTTG